MNSSVHYESLKEQLVMSLQSWTRHWSEVWVHGRCLSFYPTEHVVRRGKEIKSAWQLFLKKKRFTYIYTLNNLKVCEKSVSLFCVKLSLLECVLIAKRSSSILLMTLVSSKLIYMKHFESIIRICHLAYLPVSPWIFSGYNPFYVLHTQSLHLMTKVKKHTLFI